MVKQFGSMKRLLGQLSAWCGVVGLTTALMVGLEDGKVESYGGMRCLDTPIRERRGKWQTSITNYFRGKLLC